jgi:hypothetical protein
MLVLDQFSQIRSELGALTELMSTLAPRDDTAAKKQHAVDLVSGVAVEHVLGSARERRDHGIQYCG